MPAPLRHSSPARAETLTMRPPPVPVISMTAVRQHSAQLRRFMSICCRNVVMLAQPEPLCLRLIEAGHVADRAGAEQNLDDRAAQRAGAAGDDDMPITEIHALSSPIRHSRQAGPARNLYHRREGNPVADFDLAVIGGGINGTGIARDAAGRGLRVVLVEQNDLASATSSASSKLIHGGLRYLEHYEFGLVRAALKEREVLLRAAPHLIRPLRFVLPVNEARRSAL